MLSRGESATNERPPDTGTRSRGWPWVAAHVAALTPLPSALWRLTLVFGWPGGYTAEGLVQLGVGGWSGKLYLVVLSVLTEAAALLTLGLVSRWGEIAPTWVPFVGGKALPMRLVVAIAGSGAVILIVLWTPNLFWWALSHPDLTHVGTIVIGLLYLPLVAWGPLLGVVTIAYARRRRVRALAT